MADLAHDRSAVVETRHRVPESALRAAIDEAVRCALPEALARAFTETDSGTEPAAERPLHELSNDEFHASSMAAWTEQGRRLASPTWSPRRPMTVSELIAGRYEDDGTA
ncbi:hypothetical protein [Streptomyces sp. NPDC008139]|uniref:hypothetical protein n=1 Tax=Streptomyces sp. NPDC008139 TaxID=3364814 RepID=UPI0036E84DAE